MVGVLAGCGTGGPAAGHATKLTALRGYYTDYASARTVVKAYLNRHAAVAVYLPTRIAGGTQPLSVVAAVSHGGYRVTLAASHNAARMVLAAQLRRQTAQLSPFFAPSTLPPEAAQGEVMLSRKITGTNFTGGPVTRESQATWWRERGWRFTIYSCPSEEPPDRLADSVIRQLGSGSLPSPTGYAAYRIVQGKEVSEASFMQGTVRYKVFSSGGHALADAEQMVRTAGAS